jgi:hypothetical protein
MFNNHSFTIAAFSLLWSIGLSAQSKLDDNLANTLSNMRGDDTIRVIIVLQDQINHSAMKIDFESRHLSQSQRVGELVSALNMKALTTQSPLIQVLESKLEATPQEVRWYKSFWICNMMVAVATKNAVIELALRSDVGKIYEDGRCTNDEDVQFSPSFNHSNPTPARDNLRAINAHRLWERGITGVGSLVMNIDDGVAGEHPALFNSWKGREQGIPYYQAWRDSIFQTVEPTDLSVMPTTGSTIERSRAHGTFVMGLMVGIEPGIDTIGVAFGAKWIGAAAIDLRDYIPQNLWTSLIFDAFEWALLLPHVPDVVNCSFNDPNVSATECQPNIGGYWTLINNFELSGSVVIFGAGNAGPNPQTMTPPKNNPKVFSVGAIDMGSPILTIRSSSSRGPSRCDGSIKPDVTAPGGNVYSLQGIGYDQNQNAYVPASGIRISSGTSFAAPHLGGAIALLKQAFPTLTAFEIRDVLKKTAHAPSGANWGTLPNNNYGYGMIDCEAAYQYILNNSIILDQKFENGARIINSQIRHWSGSQYQSLEPGKRIFVTQNSNELFKGDQNLFSNEKYNTWVVNNQTREPDVSNHHFFLIQPNTTSLTSQFVQTEEQALVKSELIDAPNLAWGTVGFKDPWLIDFNDAPYGLRNRGMAAPFYDRSSPFAPDLTSAYPVQSGSATYKGVFLNQGGINPTNPQPPYYSARAQSSQTIGGYTGDFLGWAGVGATPSTPAALETPVVFTAPNAVVSARYKGRLLSSLANATSAGNQQRLANAQGSTLYNNVFYLVYESAGKIWLTYSTNGGTSWTNEQYLGDGKNPTVAASSGIALIAWNTGTGQLNCRLFTYDPVVPSLSSILHIPYGNRVTPDAKVVVAIPPNSQSGINASLFCEVSVLNNPSQTRLGGVRVSFSGNNGTISSSYDILNSPIFSSPNASMDIAAIQEEATFGYKIHLVHTNYGTGAPYPVYYATVNTSGSLTYTPVLQMTDNVFATVLFLTSHSNTRADTLPSVSGRFLRHLRACQPQPLRRLSLPLRDLNR